MTAVLPTPHTDAAAMLAEVLRRLDHLESRLVGSPRRVRGRKCASDGYTPRELARVLRVSPDRIRAMIERGELGAVNTATAKCRRPRYKILPRHVAEWEESRKAKKPAPPKRRPVVSTVDYFPDY